MKMNKKLKNFSPEGFYIISVDSDKTKVLDDAYTIGIYDEEHFFLEVFIANPFDGGVDKDRILKYAKKCNDDEIPSGIKKPFLDIFSLSDEDERSCFDFRFLVDLEGNLTDFHIKKSNVMIDQKLNSSDIIKLINTDEDDLNSVEEDLLNMLNAMYAINDIIFMNRYKDGNVDKRDDEKDFCMNFISQIKELVNFNTPKFFDELGLPCLKFNLIRHDSNNSNFRFFDGYYSTEFSHNACYKDEYAPFTTPLRSYASFINLAILNDYLDHDKIVKPDYVDGWNWYLRNMKIEKLPNEMIGQRKERFKKI